MGGVGEQRVRGGSSIKGPIVYYFPGGGGGFGELQFFKRVNLGGSVLKMYKVLGGSKF